MTALRHDLPTADAIHVRGAEKSFGETRVLHGINLDIPAGQFVAIIGRSGCGKSTLLRLIAGLDDPTSGQVEIGAVPAGEAEHTRLMFQEPRLLPWASVLRNVEVGLGAARRKPGALAQALDALRAVGLEARGHDWPSVLSGGQKQRVALARALVSRPRVLALDEPLGALDALTRIEMQGLLERVWQDQGFTAVLVTHDVSEALALADRVVMIEDGAIALDLEVPLPRPRRRGSIALAQLEERILKLLLKNDLGAPEYAI
ncbi:ATP-binding cassette domain-containing protein [Elstera cyanobacteriorum]|uniref:ATP-binding cassette domain-containing protein n=1 Tax=Elstera cyanobacteriorum TaxID=2022747 RepID=UPI002356514D|nr:ATP-binding cassette domain-containing protein [Elstera cyanobacteriorum]MCK6443086.1 ATP-binding cassette domain-containing protein [Elstera cyanobacteriorum]